MKIISCTQAWLRAEASCAHARTHTITHTHICRRCGGAARRGGTRRLGGTPPLGLRARLRASACVCALKKQVSVRRQACVHEASRLVLLNLTHDWSVFRHTLSSQHCALHTWRAQCMCQGVHVHGRAWASVHVHGLASCACGCEGSPATQRRRRLQDNTHQPQPCPSCPARVPARPPDPSTSCCHLRCSTQGIAARGGKDDVKARLGVRCVRRRMSEASSGQLRTALQGVSRRPTPDAAAASRHSAKRMLSDVVTKRQSSGSSTSGAQCRPPSV